MFFIPFFCELRINQAKEKNNSRIKRTARLPEQLECINSDYFFCMKDSHQNVEIKPVTSMSRLGPFRSGRSEIQITISGCGLMIKGRMTDRQNIR